VGSLQLKTNVNGTLVPTTASACLAGMPYIVIPHPGTGVGSFGGADGFVIYQ